MGFNYLKFFNQNNFKTNRKIVLILIGSFGMKLSVFQLVYRYFCSIWILVPTNLDLFGRTSLVRTWFIFIDLVLCPLQCYIITVIIFGEVVLYDHELLWEASSQIKTGTPIRCGICFMRSFFVVRGYCFILGVVIIDHKYISFCFKT